MITFFSKVKIQTKGRGQFERVKKQEDSCPPVPLRFRCPGMEHANKNVVCSFLGGAALAIEYGSKISLEHGPIKLIYNG